MRMGRRKLYGLGALFEVAFCRFLSAPASSGEFSQYNSHYSLSLKARTEGQASGVGSVKLH